MERPDMLTSLDAELLAGAFPAALRAEALIAAESALARLEPEQWTELFPVRVDGQALRIPARLHFRSNAPPPDLCGTARLMLRCLQTRSSDGYQRQRAVRDVVADLQPWSAPFVVDLIGSYVIEILVDIHAALSPEKAATIAPFLAANPDYWQCIRARVMSYWDVYYRDIGRSHYVGFALVDLLDQALGADWAALPPMRGRRFRRVLARSGA